MAAVTIDDKYKDEARVLTTSSRMASFCNAALNSSL
jgi:hypothetical protein